MNKNKKPNPKEIFNISYHIEYKDCELYIGITLCDGTYLDFKKDYVNIKHINLEIFNDIQILQNNKDIIVIEDVLEKRNLKYRSIDIDLDCITGNDLMEEAFKAGKIV